jgi:YD repeat-containing protein
MNVHAEVGSAGERDRTDGQKARTAGGRVHWWSCCLSLRLKTLIVATILLFGSAAHVWASNVTFVYDWANRLLASWDSNGNVTNYRYDMLGNVTSVVTTIANPSAALVFGYSPSEEPGVSGFGFSSLFIFGKNFSSTSNQNTVKIGGQTASVMFASPTTLWVQPSAHTPIGSDAVTVTCPAGTGTGPNLIVVNY